MGVNKLVMKNNNPKASGNDYIYGSTAYDYEKPKKSIKDKKPIEKPKVKKKKSNKNKAKLKLMLSVSVVFLMAFITVGRYTAILTLSSDIRDQKQEVQNIQKDNQNVKVELAKLNNTKDIEQEAINKHKMTYPTKENTIFISVAPLKSESPKDKQTESALTTMQRILGLIY